MIILGGCTEDHRIDNLQQEIVSLKKEITELKQQMELEQMFKNFSKIYFEARKAVEYRMNKGKKRE